MLYFSDTIVALATPIGPGSVGIIRLSGPASFQILSKIFSGSRSDFESYKLYHGHIKDPKSSVILDDGLVVFMKAPNTFTGEDVVELQLHGSPVNLQRVIKLILNLGARLALPGEFSKRAYLNGRMDLTQAEAIADLIAAQSESQTKNSLLQLEGYLSRVIHDMTSTLNRCLALIEIGFDFSDQDLDEASKTEVIKLLQSVLNNLGELIASFKTGQMLYQGLKIALVGKPNVGKSSLMNTLLKEDKSIIHSTAGTTRDILSGKFFIDQTPVTLYDTAGIHSTDNEVETIGIQKSQLLLEQVDLILLLLDMSRPLSEDDKQLWLSIKDKNYVLVGTKSDLPHVWTNLHRLGLTNDFSILSSQTQEGIDELLEVIRQKLGLLESSSNEVCLINNVRHYESLSKAFSLLENIIRLYETSLLQEEMLSEDIKQVAKLLQDVTGSVNSETVLDEIFSKFCIGK